METEYNGLVDRWVDMKNKQADEVQMINDQVLQWVWLSYFFHIITFRESQKIVQKMFGFGR